jgi:ABC-2 type transport system permease protein
MTPDRISTLIGKEFREFRANPAAILPVAFVILVCVAVPFVVVIVIPRLLGESLAADRNLNQIVGMASRSLPGLAALSADAAVEAFLFQQFLLLFLIAPVVGAVSLAAYTVVGEKQGRTLEPLLTTPLSTTELLLAKALASFLPSITIEVLGLAAYFGLVGILALPGVPASLLTGRTFILVGLVGPLALLASVQMTIAISSRVNDPRSAQQIAVLLVLPLAMMLVGQIAGAFVVTTPMLLLIAVVLAAIWVVLVLFSVTLFDRETILTRWK